MEGGNGMGSWAKSTRNGQGHMKPTAQEPLPPPLKRGGGGKEYGAGVVLAPRSTIY